MISVLIVCMGNICRSPMASAVASALAKRLLRNSATGEVAQRARIEFDSAGTHAHHLGEKTDSRANATLLRHGFGASEHRSRRIQPRDFERFDLILAMDRSNLGEVHRRCPAEMAWKLHLFLDFVPELVGRDVPDPYYGSVHGFERVFELCVAGATGVIESQYAAHLGAKATPGQSILADAAE